MADEELERRIAGLEHQHRLMRWYIGRVDRDLAEIAGTQVEHTERLDRIDTKLVEHTERLDRIETRLDRMETKLVEHGGRFDSLDAQMRSLTQLVGEVLNRLPEPGQ